MAGVSRGMRPRDVYELTGASDPRLRPDGAEVAYVVWWIDEEANEYHQADLARAHGRLGAAAPVHERAEGRPAAVVARRHTARVRLRPRRREGEAAALRDAGGRRRAEKADRFEGGRRRAGLVARRHAHRVHRARPRRGVRGGGRQEARAAPVHAAALQARQRRLDGRPPPARLRRARRRLGGGEAAHGRRLRGQPSGLVAGRHDDRVRVGARRRLGHRAAHGHLHRPGRRWRAEAADAERQRVRRTGLLRGRRPPRSQVGARRLRLPPPRADRRRRRRDGREPARADGITRPQLRPLPGAARPDLG